MFVMRRGLAAFVLGVAFGVLVVAINASSAPALHVLSYLTGTESGWCFMGILGGALMARPLWGPLGGSATLVAAVCSYYAADTLRGVYGGISQLRWDWIVGDLSTWTPMAVGAGCVFGLLGGVARSGGVWGWLATAVFPGYLLWQNRSFLWPPFGTDMVGVTVGAESGLPDQAALYAIWLESSAALAVMLYLGYRVVSHLVRGTPAEARRADVSGVGAARGV